MLSVELLGSQSQLIAVFLFVRVKTHGVVAAIRLGHALGEGTCAAHQVGQSSRVLVILLVVFLLRPDDYPHVAKSDGFGVGSRWIALKLRLIGCRRLGGFRLG